MAQAVMTTGQGGGVPSKRTLTGFVRAIKSRDERALAETYGSRHATASRQVRKTAMSENVGMLGGYTVPPDFTMRLMETIAENSFVYPRANIIPMFSGETECPKVDVETVQAAGTAPWFGGVKYVWGSENAPTETDPAFRQLSLRAWDLLGYTVISDDLLMDTGPEGEEYLVRLFGKAAAWSAEYAFLQGLGAGALMPLGVIKSPAAILVTRAGAGGISNVDLGKMAAHMLPYGWQNGIWATSPTCMEKIVQATGYQLNTAPERGDGAAGTLLTRPLFITDKLPPLGTQGDLVFFDPSLYAIGIRQEVVIDVSGHTLFRTRQTVFRVWLRLDGKCQVSGPVTLPDGSSTVSPIVVLN